MKILKFLLVFFTENPEELKDSESNKHKSFTEVQESLDFVGEDDTMHSAELIESAYKRDQLKEDCIADNEIIKSEYIPPELEIIAGGFDEDSSVVIPVLPDYALTEEEREFALTRSEFFYGVVEREDELAKVREEKEIDEFDCFDLDDIASPAEKEWFYDEVEVAQIEEYEDECLEVEAIEVVAEEEFCEVVDLENSQPAEKEWQESVARPYRELAEISELVSQAEERVSKLQFEAGNMQAELNNRDETILMQGAEMQRMKDLRRAVEAEMMHDSQKFAETLSLLQDYRQEKDRTEQELLIFGNEIELLHAQLFNVNEALTKQAALTADKDRIILSVNNNNDSLRAENNKFAAEIAELVEKHQDEIIKNNEQQLALRGIIADLDCEKEELCKDLHESRLSGISLQDKYEDSLRRLNYDVRTFAAKVSELELEKKNLELSLREQSESIVDKNGIIISLSHKLDEVMFEAEELKEREEELAVMNRKQARRIKRLEKLRTKMKRLEFENNVFNTETVPNLQKDKEDLVELASEEYNRAQSLDELSAKRARRASYTTTLAAAACLLLVLMPVLSWNNIETQRNDIKSDYAMQVAAVEADNVMLKEERDALREEVDSLNEEFDSARKSWSLKLSALQQENSRRINQEQIIQASVEFSDTDFDVEAMETSSVMNKIAEIDIPVEQYNDVSGIAEYQAEVMASSMELLKGKKARVRAGEGLSQVLWRVYRTSSPEMVAYIAELNNLSKDKRGQPMLKINQQLKLPKDVNTAMAASTSKKRSLRLFQYN